MSLSTIQQHVLNPFIEESLQNLKTMAGMEGHTDPGFTDEVDKFRFKGYAVCAETQGAIDGVILMHHYIETAVAIGNAVQKEVLGVERSNEDVNEEAADALAEWGNTVLGRATRDLSQSQLNIQFEPPYFVRDMDTMSALLTGVKDIITVPVHVDGVGRFFFNYLIRSMAEDLNTTQTSDTDNPLSTQNHYLVPDKEHHIGLAKDSIILIVDDMKMMRTSIKRYLNQLGYNNTIEAENGAIAVEKFKESAPKFVFMDMVMPEKTGDQALKEMRNHAQETPIVMLSSVADVDMISECEKSGMTGYIVKPLTTDTGPKTLDLFLNPDSGLKAQLH